MMNVNIFEAIGYPLFAVSGLEILLGIILLRNNPRGSNVNRAVAALSFASAGYSFFTALMYIRTSLGLPLDLYARLSWVGWFAPPAGLQSIFYMKQEHSRPARLVGFILYPFWFVILVLCLFTDLLEPSGYSLRPYVNHTGLLENPVRFFGALLALWVIYEAFRLRRESIGRRRIQINYFLAGTVIFSAGGAVLGGFQQFLSRYGFDSGFGAYFSFPWVVLVFTGITRHGLFDIRLVVSRTVSALLLSGLFVSLHVILFILLEPNVGAVPAILLSLLFIGIIFFGTRFNRSVQAWIQQLVVKDKYDYQVILKESIKAILRILDLDELLNFLLESMRKGLGVKSVGLFLRDQRGGFFAQRGMEVRRNAPREQPVDTLVVKRIMREGRVLIREELENAPADEESRAVIEYMKNASAELLVPLFNKGMLHGFLSLGQKGTGDSYMQSDINLLETLAGHAAIALENARLYNEARRTKDSLLESESKFRTLAQTTPSAIVIHRGGRFLYANPACEAMAGYAQEEFLSLDFRDIVHHEFRKPVREWEFARLQDNASSDSSYEFKIVRKDGSERWVLMTVGRLDYEGRPAVIGTLVDITERKVLEGRLRYSQKMEAIGKLAGGVAHDFNNVLTAIVGYANVMYLKIGKDDPLRTQVDQILASTERAANMTQRLLAFGKKQVVSLRPEDLNSIVMKMEKLLSGLLREGTGLTMRYHDGRLPVLADSGQVERIIMNLLVNARDAMPGGGTVTIETGVEQLNEEFISRYGYGKMGSYAVVSVNDTGEGMSAAIRERIFEPFFTTKGLSKGTGFGLSIVYDIVKEHQGFITVESKEGQGSTFKVYLPAAEVKAAEDGAAVSVTSSVRGNETILVADNEEDVREFIKAVLEGYGYTVIDAVDGKDAVAKFTEYKDSIRLLVLDAIMPAMNGIDAYKAIRKKRPKIPALFTSGYPERTIQEKGMMVQGQHFMVKPFTPKDMLARVRGILDLAQEQVS